MEKTKNYKKRPKIIFSFAFAVLSGTVTVFLDEITRASFDKYILAVFHDTWHVQRGGKRDHDLAATSSLLHVGENLLRVAKLFLSFKDLLVMHSELLNLSFDRLLQLDELRWRNLSDIDFLVSLREH